MQIQDLINAAGKAAKENRMRDTMQLTLGKLIEQLQACDLTGTDGKPKSICYDFCRFRPTSLMSWRGSYAELALGYKENGDYPSAQSILEDCQSSIGATYQGYKGGDFVMDADTPVWVANYGNSSETAIVGVVDAGYQIVLLTAYCEY